MKLTRKQTKNASTSKNRRGKQQNAYVKNQD